MVSRDFWQTKGFKQFLKFITVGFMGTIIDFGILNLLSWLTGVTSGDGIIPINIVAFVSALTFSFYFNKRWTFDDLSVGETHRKFTWFLLISLGGVTINTLIVRFLTTNINPAFDVDPRLWLNIAKFLATGASGLWNFFGYKLIVFKK